MIDYIELLLNEYNVRKKVTAYANVPSGHRTPLCRGVLCPDGTYLKNDTHKKWFTYLKNDINWN